MPTIRKLFLLKIVAALGLIVGAVALAHTVQADRIPDALLAQSRHASEAGKPDKAIHYLRQYLEFQRDDIDATVRLAELMKERSDRPSLERLLILEKILRADPTRLAIRKEALSVSLALARANFQGRYTVAAGHGAEVVAADPGDALAWTQLATAQAALQHNDDARKSFEGAITADPADPIAYQRLAQFVWRELKDPPGAKQVLDRLVSALPFEAESYLARARFENAVNSVLTALPDVRKALELDPDNPEALAFLADHYQRERKPALARECLANGLAKYPTDVRMIRGLAWLDLNLGNIGAAVAVLEGGLARVPNGFDLMMPLADLLVQLGRTDRSEAIVKKLEGRNDPEAKKQVRYLKARLAMRANEWEKATKLLTELRADAVELPGLEAQTNLLLAACAQRMADPEAEQEALRRVLVRDPSHLAARLGLAQSLVNSGRAAEALSELDAALKLPNAGFPVVAQYVRLKARALQWGGGSAAEWQALDRVVDQASRGMNGQLDPVLLRANVLSARGDAKGAALSLRKESIRRPGDPRLWAALADAMTDLAGVNAGLAVLDEAQAASGDGAELRLARADLYARDPARLRPVEPLTAHIDSWPDADQSRLLFGLVEVFDRLGDDEAVIRTYRKIAARRPGDIAVWETVAERAARAGDKAATMAARDALAKLDAGGKSLALADAWAALAGTSATRETYDNLVKAFGEQPSRGDVCVAMGRLAARLGDSASSVRLLSRAAKLEPSRLTPATANLAAAGERLPLEIVRLAADPKWGGDPFRRAIRGACQINPTAAGKILAAARPYLEREPGGLGWVGDQFLIQGLKPEALDCFKKAVSSPLATADDELRLAVRLGQLESPAAGTAVMAAAKAKIPAAIYYATAASFAESEFAPKEWKPDCPTPAAERLWAQGRLALQLSRYRRDEAIAMLEDYQKRATAGPDVAWADRNLAMLLAVRADTGDRQKAMALLTRSDDIPAETADEKRATAAVLTALARHLDGADRQKVTDRATRALEALVTETLSPRDAYLLAQVYRASGDRKSSSKVLDSLLKADPRNLEFHVMALEEITDGGDLKAGAPFAERILGLYPKDFRAISVVARYECQAGNPERALALAEGYQRTADAAAGDLPAKSARVAELLDELARRPKVRNTPTGTAMINAALARYDTLLATRPDVIVAECGLMGVANRHADAFALIEQQPGLTPRMQAAAGLAALRTPGGSERQFQTVRQWLEVATNQEPESATLALSSAELASLRNDYATAAANYTKVLERDPKNVIALNNLAWVLAPRPESAAKAEELVKRAVAEVGLTGELLDTRARIRIAEKKYELAEKDLREALAQEKTPLRFFHLALAKDAQTKGEGEKQFRQAKERGLQPKTVHPADLPRYKEFEAMRNAG